MCAAAVRHGRRSGVPPMSSMPRILSLSTGWCSIHGGINSFNTEICAALAQIGCPVDCIVLEADTADVANAQRRGVRLLSLNQQGGDFNSALGTQVGRLLKAEGLSPDVWIGHDLITGPPMLTAHALARATTPKVMFHHMHYLSYKALEGRSSCNSSSLAVSLEGQED